MTNAGSLDSLKILFVGDVVGRPGRRAVRTIVPELLEKHGIDLCVANAENAAGGYGITRDTAQQLFDAGVDVLTGGNHLWDKKEIMEILEEDQRILRPANYPPGTPGEGSCTYRSRSGEELGVIHLVGRVFMREVDCPFRIARPLAEELRRRTPMVLVDFHAEATSEKRAMGWYLAGKVSSVLGTHTHVQTADEEILPGGTAYVTDVGMTGPFDSVIGMQKEEALGRFLTQLPAKLNPAKRDVRLSAVVLELDRETGGAVSIERIQLPLPAE